MRTGVIITLNKFCKVIYQQGVLSRPTRPSLMRRDADCRASSSCFERQDLRPIYPRDDVDRPTEYEQVYEEERDCRARCVLVAEAEDRNHHYTNCETCSSPHHRQASSHTIKSKQRRQIAKDEHELDEVGDELRCLWREFDVRDWD